MPGMEHLKTPFPPMVNREQTQTEMLARLESLMLKNWTVHQATKQLRASYRM